MGPGLTFLRIKGYESIRFMYNRRTIELFLLLGREPLSLFDHCQICMAFLSFDLVKI